MENFWQASQIIEGETMSQRDGVIAESPVRELMILAGAAEVAAQATNGRRIYQEQQI